MTHFLKDFGKNCRTQFSSVQSLSRTQLEGQFILPVNPPNSVLRNAEIERHINYVLETISELEDKTNRQKGKPNMYKSSVSLNPLPMKIHLDSFYSLRTFYTVVT